MKNRVFIEKELDEETEKKIKKNLIKIGNALHELRGMGYEMYLSPNMLNVCDGDTHPNGHQDQSVVVASVFVSGIDAGDW